MCAIIQIGPRKMFEVGSMRNWIEIEHLKGAGEATLARVVIYERCFFPNSSSYCMLVSRKKWSFVCLRPRERN